MFKQALNNLLNSAANNSAKPADTQVLGQLAEQLAKKHLIKQGLSPVEQNYHCQYGEIDLIMKDRQYWVFTEVRYRSSDQFGGGIASVNHRKQQKLIRTAEHFIQHRSDAFDCCRFDVIALSGPIKQVKIDWIKDAFS